MAAKKKTKRADRLAEANPITGEAPNSYTASTDRELAAPKDVRQFNSPGGQATQRRLRKSHKEAVGPGGAANPTLGYDKPEGMSDRDHAWLMGAHHMFPNMSTGPAINEPHEGTPGVTVQRRAEDLTKGEYNKAKDVLKHFGHDPKDPVGSLTGTVHRQFRRVMAEHLRAGVDESASQLFYGGPVSTDFGENYDADEHHTEGVRQSTDTFNNYADNIASHPRFQAQMSDASHAETRAASRNLLAQAAADTSPNAKWRENAKWPNLDQASESVHAAMEDRMPRFITGRTPNEVKAANRAADMLSDKQFDSHKYGNQYTAPKTIAFRGALIDRDAPDAYTVTDVHHASIVFPGLDTAKSKRYNGPTGTVTVHADEPESATKGLAPRQKVRRDGTIVPDWGYSRPEQALDVGKPYVHAVVDRAMRQVASDIGISRSVDHADNVHAMQAAMWGSQQVRRPDVNVSHADQYPVVRDWAAEGHDELNEDGRALFGTRTGMGPQFVKNPNTKAMSKDGSSSHDVHRKPYDLDS